MSSSVPSSVSLSVSSSVSSSGSSSGSSGCNVTGAVVAKLLFEHISGWNRILQMFKWWIYYKCLNDEYLIMGNVLLFVIYEPV